MSSRHGDLSRPVGPSRSGGFQYAAAALIFVLSLLGSHLATPLYHIWQTDLGLSTTQVTMIFACYQLGVTAGLLLGGGLGDQLGRKPLLLTGIVLTIASSVIYLLATGALHLVAARLLNGLAIGLMSGSAVAAIVELHPTGDRTQGSRLGAATALASPALGLIVATLIVSVADSPATATTLPFAIQICGLAAALVLLTSIRETLAPAARRTLRTASFRPQGLSVPPEIRRTFLFAASAGILAWANTGLWLSLGPSIVHDILGSDNRLLGGLVVVAFLSAAGLVQFFTRGVGVRRMLLLGLGGIAPSLVIINLTLLLKSGVGVMLGAILAGCAQGLAWMGCTEITVRIAPQDVRASVLSTLYVCGYFGAAAPVLVTGFLADAFGLLPAAMALSAALCALVVAMVLWQLRLERAGLLTPDMAPNDRAASRPRRAGIRSR